MPKKFSNVEECRAYWKQWYENNKHRASYKEADRATKKRIRKERSDWFQEFKKNLKCSRCPEDDFRALDLHHKDPSQKKDSVSNLAHRGLSKEKILVEIEKCEVLCANCHRKEHWTQKNGD